MGRTISPPHLPKAGSIITSPRSPRRKKGKGLFFCYPMVLLERYRYLTGFVNNWEVRR